MVFASKPDYQIFISFVGDKEHNIYADDLSFSFNVDLVATPLAAAKSMDVTEAYTVDT